ncbi:hypothetical protein BDR26DRAFT_242537 [Obelidium mucronatum]|nr:hypothetical protein BDR26DRAFT_242537 [Obelidium mucronatum]
MQPPRDHDRDPPISDLLRARPAADEPQQDEHDDDDGAAKDAHNADAPDGTLTGFLWQLLSATLADDTAYSFEHREKPLAASDNNSDNNNNNNNINITEEPIHIEYVETKHSLIDLSPQMKPSAAEQLKSPSIDPTPLTSLFSYGKSLLSQISQPASSPPKQSQSLSTLDSATREERSSVLDLHAPTKPIVLSRGPKLPDSTPVILSDALSSQLRPHLPPLYRESSTWRLIYSLDHHGISLNTLYGNCEANGLSNPVLVVVKNDVGNVFGAFANEGLRVQHGYYGNGSW